MIRPRARRLLAVATATTALVLLGAGPAAADNCGFPADCFATARAAVATAVGVGVFGAILSFALDVSPLGTAKGIWEAITGRDAITGEELGTFERFIGAVPGVGAVLGGGVAAGRLVGRLDDAADLTHDARRTGSTLPGAAFPGVRDYTGEEGYRVLNPYLRDPGRYTDAERAALQARADAVSADLARLPAVPGTTYRGADLTDELLARYEPGQVVTERGFTSTSRDVAVAQGDFGGNTLFTVTGRSGRDVAPVSQFPGEAEILYDRGTAFRVTGRVWDADLRKWLITLEEVTP